MTTTAVTSLKVNMFSFSWTEHTRRKAKPCVECGNPTFGRSDIPDSSKKRGFRTEVACIGCAMKRAMRLGLSSSED